MNLGAGVSGQPDSSSFRNAGRNRRHADWLSKSHVTPVWIAGRTSQGFPSTTRNTLVAAKKIDEPPCSNITAKTRNEQLHAWPEHCVGFREGRFARMLGAILFLALLHYPSRAWSATPSLTLQWDRSASTDVIGYRIYYGATSGESDEQRGSGQMCCPTPFPARLSGHLFLYGRGLQRCRTGKPFSNEFTYTVPGGPAQLQIRIAANKQAILTVTGRPRTHIQNPGDTR